MSAPLLQVKDLCVNYGDVRAISNVSLTVPEGAIVTVIGPNGAGKTTLLSALVGLLHGSGSVLFQGREQVGLEVEEIVGGGLTLVPEKRELFIEMSVHDNLVLGAFLRSRKRAADMKADLEEVFVIFPRLRERSSQLAGTLSGGERQMLALGRALMARPRLLMLDEPSLGLAPLIIRDVFRVIYELRRRGVSILLVEQNARAALNVADYGYVLESGEVRFHGTASELAGNPNVARAYLGAAASVASNQI